MHLEPGSLQGVHRRREAILNLRSASANDDKVVHILSVSTSAVGGATTIAQSVALFQAGLLNKGLVNALAQIKSVAPPHGHNCKTRIHKGALVDLDPLHGRDAKVPCTYAREAKVITKLWREL